MKSTQKWNWLMPNEYHWIAVIVERMFVTWELFIKHQFHLKSSDAMKCTDIPKVFSENAGAPEAISHHHQVKPSPGETITRWNHHQVKPSPGETSSQPAWVDWVKLFLTSLSEGSVNHPVITEMSFTVLNYIRKLLWCDFLGGKDWPEWKPQIWQSCQIIKKILSIWYYKKNIHFCQHKNAAFSRWRENIWKMGANRQLSCYRNNLH